MNLIHNSPQCLLAGSTAHQGFTRPFSSAVADRELVSLSPTEDSVKQIRDLAMPRLEYRPKHSGEDDGLLCKRISIMEWEKGWRLDN